MLVLLLIGLITSGFLSRRVCAQFLLALAALEVFTQCHSKSFLAKGF